jgi:hypothetical protein
VIANQSNKYKGLSAKSIPFRSSFPHQISALQKLLEVVSSMTLAHVLCALHFGCALRAINNQIVTTTNDFARKRHPKAVWHSID